MIRNAELIMAWAVGAIFGACVAMAIMLLVTPAHASTEPGCFMLMMQSEDAVTIDWPCVEAVADGRIAGTTAGDRMIARSLLATRKGRR